MMNVKYTDEMLQKLEEYGKTLPPFSEEFDRKMTRKIMKMSAEIPWLFEVYRVELRKRRTEMKEMEKKTSNLKANEETKAVLRLICSLVAKETEEKINIWDHIEALALNQIEFRKDLGKIVKTLEKTHKNKKSVIELQNKMRDAEDDLQEFRKTKPYIKFSKRYFDERKGHTEDD